MSEQQQEQPENSEQDGAETDVVCSGGFRLPPLVIRFGDKDNG